MKRKHVFLLPPLSLRKVKHACNTQMNTIMIQKMFKQNYTTNFKRVNLPNISTDVILFIHDFNELNCFKKCIYVFFLFEDYFSLQNAKCATKGIILALNTDAWRQHGLFWLHRVTLIPVNKRQELLIGPAISCQVDLKQ